MNNTDKQIATADYLAGSEVLESLPHAMDEDIYDYIVHGERLSDAAILHLLCNDGMY